MGGIVVVGSLNQDQRMRVATIPRPGETIPAQSLERSPGGKGANQAVAVARLNGSCVLVGAVGDDGEGARLIDDLSAAGVDTKHIQRLPGQVTGTATILVDDDGQNCIVAALGANLALGPRTVRSRLEAVGRVETVLTQGEVSVQCITACAEFCREHAARLVVNLAPYRDLPEEVLSLCDPLIVNELEAQAVGERLGYSEAPSMALARSLAAHCRAVIITLGAEGAVYAHGRSSGHVTAPAVNVVDTTGAGDAFVGAATVSLTRLHDLAVGCRVGVDAGSAAVQYHGAQPVVRGRAGVVAGRSDGH